MTVSATEGFICQRCDRPVVDEQPCPWCGYCRVESNGTCCECPDENFEEEIEENESTL
jgi:hypothetical protein